MLIIICVGLPAHANYWLVDEARWHASAHGQIACLVCHGEKSDSGVHPDPGAVNRSRQDFFRPEQCQACHEQVWSELKDARHAGKPLDTVRDYSNCIACHDPHYQIKAADASGRYNPALPLREQCGACHELRDVLPQLDPADEVCMVCHRWKDPREPSAVEHSRVLCLTCHREGSRAAGGAGSRRAAVLDMGPEGFVPHKELACLACHPQAAQFGHSRQTVADCRHCHVRHDEAVAHDAHLGVSCGACHLKQVSAYKDRATGIIGWARPSQIDTASRIHNMVFGQDQASCRRCHRSPNMLGAAAMVLPAKSILCMPCHAATLSAADTTTQLALIVFACGMMLSLSYWFSGSLPGAGSAGMFGKAAWIIHQSLKTIFSSKIFRILKILALDGLLQLKFYRHSPSRWLVHGLMVWPFVLRFLWGIVALTASLWTTGSDWPWALLDKNNAVHGIFFDATGLMIIVGAAVAVLRSAFTQSSKLPALPRHDRLASGLLGAIVGVGFVLEAMRISMTGYPPGSAYAFVGDAFSRFFFGVSELEDIYGYVWYIHAVLTGVFVAYLPFSRMFHIVLAPVVLALNAAADSKQHRH
jgi:nitrate reductase gamma subunit